MPSSIIEAEASSLHHVEHDDPYSDEDTGDDDQPNHQRKYIAVDEHRHTDLNDDDDDCLLQPMSSDGSAVTLEGDADTSSNNTAQSPFLTA